MRFRRRRNRPYRVTPFKRALIVAPFQIPLIAYLAYSGLIYIPLAPMLAEQIGAHYLWPIYVLAGFLLVGSVTTLIARVRDNERWEAFGLTIIMLGILEASIVEGYFGMWLGLGDNLAFGLGCFLRIRVIAMARKMERLANTYALNGHGAEGEDG